MVWGKEETRENKQSSKTFASLAMKNWMANPTPFQVVIDNRSYCGIEV